MTPAQIALLRQLQCGARLSLSKRGDIAILKWRQKQTPVQAQTARALLRRGLVRRHNDEKAMRVFLTEKGWAA